MLCRLVGNIVGGDVPAEVEERVKEWSAELHDEECRVCGDLVGRLDDGELWEMWPKRLRSSDGVVIAGAVTVQCVVAYGQLHSRVL